jgi:short-subunit dehydrogenase involved in D-alanine esterification of teichoic acids
MIIDGLAAIVTGGASGLGGAVATMLAKRGARVSVFDLNATLGPEKAAEIGGQFFGVNVTDEATVEAALLRAESAHGKARLLVNCAGTGLPAKVVSRDGTPQPLSDFAKIVSINLLGTFNVLAKFAARIHDGEAIGEERAVIINTASVAAYDGQIGQAAYSASKAGVVGMTLPDCSRVRSFWYSSNDDCPRDLPHTPSWRFIPGGTGVSWQTGTLSKSLGTSRRVRAIGFVNHRESHVEWRSDSTRWGDSDGAKIM